VNIQKFIIKNLINTIPAITVAITMAMLVHDQTSTDPFMYYIQLLNITVKTINEFT